MSVSLMKYEHMLKDQEIKRRQLQNELESELEELRDCKHKLERKV